MNPNQILKRCKLKKQSITKSAKAFTALTVGATLALGATGVAQASGSPRAQHDAGSASIVNWWGAQAGHDSHDGDHNQAVVGGVISSLSSTSITVTGANSVPTVLALNSTTAILEGTTTVGASALAIGETVYVEVSPTTASTASKIVIELSRVEGKVTSVGANSMVISAHGGSSLTVDVNSTTAYSEAGSSSTFAAVFVGSSVSVSGIVLSGQTTMDALSVVISVPKDVRGVVSALSATSMTVANDESMSTVITLNSATSVLEGTLAVSASALAIGQHVDVAMSATSPSTAAKITIELVTLTGTVSAVTSSTITLAQNDGFARTINVSSTTKYAESGAALTLSAVVVGSKISAQGVVASDQTSLNALNITIAAPSDVRGVVSAASATSLTVLSPNGTSTIFSIGSATMVFEGSQSATLSALVVGERVDVSRLASAPDSATKVVIQLVHVEGKVTAIGAGTITISGPEGFSRVINVSTSTVFSEAGSTVTSSSVVVGSKISAQGVVASDQTSLNALNITIAAAKSH